MELVKGMDITLDIFDMGDQGNGIGRAAGLVVFVDGAVKGDRVLARLTQVKKSFARGYVKEIIKPSPDRIEAECPYHDLCGGCSYGCLTYEAELAVKENQVREKLARIGGVDREKVGAITGLAEPYRYRNKATMPISTGGNIKRKGGVIENLGPVAIGFYQQRSHVVVDCEDCLLLSPPAMAAAAAVRDFIEEDGLTCWDPKWSQGLFRHLVVRTAEGTGEAMVILVVNGKGIPGVQKLVTMLDDAIDETGYSLESVYININSENTSEVYGKKMQLLAGKPVIEEVMGERKFEVSPRSFYQVDPVMAEALYDQVKAFADLSGEENVLDLYCGVGTIGLWLADEAKYVAGIEIVPEAVVDANRNAVINGIVNARFLTGKAEEVMPAILKGEFTGDEVAASVVKDADIVILDPPRKGCQPELLDAVREVAPEKIIYVSCDPATLARDIAYLSDAYTVEQALPFDMFPRTNHVETVCCLSRKRVRAM